MITLGKKLKKQQQQQNQQGGNSNPDVDNDNNNRRISIRDKLLVKEVQEMESNLPPTCSVSFPDHDTLHTFVLTIVPDEGIWLGGRFTFRLHCTEDYNMTPPEVKCQTRIYHPNINEEGNVCLSLLRPSSYDGMGWAPTRRLKDVVWGINSLFTDLLNFDDPLNVEAAELYEKDKDEFIVKAKEYIKKYAER